MKFLDGFIWREGDEVKETFDPGDINHSFSAVVSYGQDSYMLDRSGRSTISRWHQSKTRLTFTKTYTHSGESTVHQLIKRDDAWIGKWCDANGRETGFILLWIREVNSRQISMRQTMEFVNSQHNRQAFN